MNTSENAEEDLLTEAPPPEEPFEEGDLLSLNQVAEGLGVSNPTARRLCMSGRLPAVKVLINEQLCWKVKSDSLKAYQEALLAEDPSEDPAKVAKLKPRKKGSSDDEKPFTITSSGDLPMEAHLAALETARRALERLERVEDQLEEQRERVELQRARADLGERQKFALEMEVRQYQAALAEHAESLAEARAERQAAELQLAHQLAAAAPAPTEKLEHLKVATYRPTFGQRVKTWLGFKAAQ